MSLEFQKDTEMEKMFTTQERRELSYKNTYSGEEENKRMQLTKNNEQSRERDRHTHTNVP